MIRRSHFGHRMPEPGRRSCFSSVSTSMFRESFQNCSIQFRLRSGYTERIAGGILRQCYPLSGKLDCGLKLTLRLFRSSTFDFK